MKSRPISAISATAAAAGGSCRVRLCWKPMSPFASTAVGFFLALQGALLFQGFRRLLLVLFLSIHTLAHDSQERGRSEEHTSELQSRQYLVCRLLLEKKKKKTTKLADNLKI